MKARRLEWVPLDDLVPALVNPNVHRGALIDESIDAHGLVETVVVDDRTGRMVAGHGRRVSLLERRASGGVPPGRVVRRSCARSRRHDLPGRQLGLPRGERPETRAARRGGAHAEPARVHGPAVRGGCSLSLNSRPVRRGSVSPGSTGMSCRWIVRCDARSRNYGYRSRLRTRSQWETPGFRPGRAGSIPAVRSRV